MGKSIDEKIEEDLKHCSLNGVKYSDYVKEHYISKDQYETRLKADMIAMLTDLQLDVEGQKFDVHIDKDVWNDAIGVCSDLIQQRINELKENTDV